MGHLSWRLSKNDCCYWSSFYGVQKREGLVFRYKWYLFWLTGVDYVSFSSLYMSLPIMRLTLVIMLACVGIKWRMGNSFKKFIPEDRICLIRYLLQIGSNQIGLIAPNLRYNWGCLNRNCPYLMVGKGSGNSFHCFGGVSVQVNAVGDSRLWSKLLGEKCVSTVHAGEGHRLSSTSLGEGCVVYPKPSTAPCC